MGDQANTAALEMVEKPAVIKPTAVHDEGQGLEDIDALSYTIGSKLEANVALNATGDRPTVWAPKSSAAIVDVVEKPVGFLATVTQDEGQEREGVNARKIGMGDGTVKNIAGEDWTVVARTPANQQQAVMHRSPKNRRSPGLKDQVITSKNIEFSNSFEALLNEHDHVMNEEGKNVQHVLCDTVQKLDKPPLH
ncbi:hypothetical protein A4A49_09628 [Nicotiana attenuata]|uniref:Uncharacterized protein n=1 Tax=Nicotiana attenuata TaxID=49451 RepID=A0A1J6IUP1_NICAT|nr:hypothetical protein A4A49_09628 [Nicotiana attenuata]